MKSLLRLFAAMFVIMGVITLATMPSGQLSAQQDTIRPMAGRDYTPPPVKIFTAADSAMIMRRAANLDRLGERIVKTSDATANKAEQAERLAADAVSHASSSRERTLQARQTDSCNEATAPKGRHFLWFKLRNKK